VASDNEQDDINYYQQEVGETPDPSKIKTFNDEITITNILIVCF
jgi:hypothetical protein